MAEAAVPIRALVRRITIGTARVEPNRDPALPTISRDSLTQTRLTVCP